MYFVLFEFLGSGATGLFYSFQLAFVAYLIKKKRDNTAVYDRYDDRVMCPCETRYSEEIAEDVTARACDRGSRVKGN